MFGIEIIGTRSQEDFTSFTPNPPSKEPTRSDKNELLSFQALIIQFFL
jgi:hypothetical protein